MASKTGPEVACLLHAMGDLVAHHVSPTIRTTHGGSIPHHRQVHPMTWDADTFTELIVEPDPVPDLFMRLLVVVTIQPFTQTLIGFELQEDRAHPVIRHHGHVRTPTATEVSRQFSTLLNSIGAGDIVAVTRGNQPITEIKSVTHRTGQDLRTTPEEIPPPDKEFVADVTGTVNFTTRTRTGPGEGAQF